MRFHRKVTTTDTIRVTANTVMNSTRYLLMFILRPPQASTLSPYPAERRRELKLRSLNSLNPAHGLGDILETLPISRPATVTIIRAWRPRSRRGEDAQGAWSACA